MNCNLIPLLWLKFRSKNDGFRLAAISDASVYVLADERRIAELSVTEASEGRPAAVRIHQIPESVRGTIGIWANRSCVYLLSGSVIRRWAVVCQRDRLAANRGSRTRFRVCGFRLCACAHR